MPLLSLEDLARELSVSADLIKELIDSKVLIPFGGRARLGAPQFSRSRLPELRATIQTRIQHLAQ